MRKKGLNNSNFIELSFCHKLWFSNFDIFANKSSRSLIFQTMNSVSSNNISLKYHRCTPSGCIDIGKRKFKCLAKTMFSLFWKVSIICYRDIKSNSLHIHLVNDKHEGFVPVGIQVAALHAGLLFLSNPLLLNIKHLHFRLMWREIIPKVLLYHRIFG